MDMTPVPLAYLSPDTYLPVTSVVATVVGLVMMFGRNTLRLFVYGFRRLGARLRPSSGMGKGLKGPHRAPAAGDRAPAENR